MRGLKNKRILVAGAASGIGAATAYRLGEEGALLMLADINEEGLAKVTADINAKGGAAKQFKFDLYDEASISRLVAHTVDTLGGIDGIANIAADLSPNTLGKDVALKDMDVTIWEKTNRANLMGYALIIREALPHLQKNEHGGAIVNTTSTAHWIGEDTRPAYAASKAGINTLSRHVAKTYGKSNIRCNSISPGAVLSETALRTMSEEFKNQVLSGICSPRLGKPSDLAQGIVFLLSDDAEWVTGQVWEINGGGGFRG